MAETTIKLDDWIILLAVIHALQVQAQALLGLITRFAAELGYAPLSPRDAANMLLEENILDRGEYELVVLALKLLSEAAERGIDP